MSVSTPIHDFLKSYSLEGAVRCHMPGQKSELFDITEIDGADSLYEAEGIIGESERNAAALFGAGKTVYSCGGSTLAIQAMLAAAKAADPRKTRVAASRWCHRSLISACALLGLEVDWILPSSFLSCDVTPRQAAAKITDRTLCLFVQSIDYYGGECDIKPLTELCRERNIPLLVDNAHGAYHVFTGRHPIKLGADMTADSAHKTLPCLTGGAYLHVSENAASAYAERAKEFTALFGSSSPSYLVLDSLDLCNRHIDEQKQRFEQVTSQIKRLKNSLLTAGYCLRKSDLMRVTIDAAQYGYSGFELSRQLREREVCAELSDGRYVVLLFSTGQNLADFQRILSAALSIPKRDPIAVAEPKFTVPTAVLSPRDALLSPTEEVSIIAAEGLICGGITCPCPPCVPIVMPGELFTAQGVRLLARYGVEKVRAVVNR